MTKVPKLSQKSCHPCYLAAKIVCFYKTCDILWVGEISTFQYLPNFAKVAANWPKDRKYAQDTNWCGEVEILLQFRDCLTDGISVWTGSISVVYLLYLLKERIEQHFQSKATTQRYMSVCVIFQTLSEFKGFCHFSCFRTLSIFKGFYCFSCFWKQSEA